MARQSTVEDLSAPGASAGSKTGGLPLVRAPGGVGAESHLPPVAAGGDLLAILVRAHVLRGDAAAALDAAGRLAAILPARPDPIDMVVDAALDRGRPRVARLVLQALGASLADPHAAMIKARIARAEGDLPAARAILVMAIERSPTHAALRVLLTEMMVAAGTASDARAVLTHLGQAPVNPIGPDEIAAPGADAEAAASRHRAPADRADRAAPRPLGAAGPPSARKTSATPEAAGQTAATAGRLPGRNTRNG